MGAALEREGKGLPPAVRKVLGTPGKTFYESEKGELRAISIWPRIR